MKSRLNAKKRVNQTITHYGYSDGSGEYYIIIDAEKCNGCGECIQKCPQNVLKMETAFIDLEDKMVAAVTEEQRKKIRYTCSPCKPERDTAPCVQACDQKALKLAWNIKE